MPCELTGLQQNTVGCSTIVQNHHKCYVVEYMAVKWAYIPVGWGQSGNGECRGGPKKSRKERNTETWYSFSVASVVVAPKLPQRVESESLTVVTVAARRCACSDSPPSLVLYGVIFIQKTNTGPTTHWKSEGAMIKLSTWFQWWHDYS